MNKKKLLSTVILIVLVILSFLSGTTFAKYLTRYQTSSTLEVAKWLVTEEFLVNGESTTSKNINLATNYNPDTLVNGKIAPGSEGSFEIVIDATGTETGLNYEVKFDNISGEVPFNFVFNSNKHSDVSFSQLAKDLSGHIAADDGNKIIRQVVTWSWPYETFYEPNTTPDDPQDTLDR